MEETDKYNTYASLLFSIFKNSEMYFDTTNTYDKLLQLLPHITSNQFNLLLKKLNTRDNPTLIIALPSVVINNLCHIIYMKVVSNNIYCVEYCKLCNATINYYSNILFMKESNYIQKHIWEKFHICGNWKETVILEFYSKQLIHDFRTYSYSMAIVYSCNIIETIRKNTTHTNNLEILDKYIEFIVFNPLIIHEISFNKHILKDTVCGYCLYQIHNRSKECACSRYNGIDHVNNISKNIYKYLILNRYKISDYYSTCDYAKSNINYESQTDTLLDICSCIQNTSFNDLPDMIDEMRQKDKVICYKKIFTDDIEFKKTVDEIYEQIDKNDYLFSDENILTYY